MINQRDINVVVFWGAILGIGQASLRYLMDLLSVDILWCIGIPINLYFLNKIYTQTKKKRTVLFAALIASGTILMNLFIGIKTDETLNATAIIISEALAMIIVYKILEKWEMNFNFFAVLSVNCTWRIIYTAYLLLMPLRFIFSSHLKDIGPSITFFFYENLVSSLIAFICLLIEKYFLKNREEESINIPPSPIISSAILVLAFIIQWSL